MIIPKLLQKLKESYESKNSLSTNERRLLCSSIVDYFESRKMKFSSNTMEELAEQVVQHFPKEDKVFSKTKEILRVYTFFKVLFSNSLRNPGVIVMVTVQAVALFTVFATLVETRASKPTTLPLQKLSLILPQESLTLARKFMMKKASRFKLGLNFINVKIFRKLSICGKIH